MRNGSTRHKIFALNSVEANRIAKFEQRCNEFFFIYIYIICIFIFAYLIFTCLINFFWLNLKITKDAT